MMIMTWLFEMYDIYPLQRFREDFMHVVLRLIEDVTTISWLFIIFAYFIALIEVGRYNDYKRLIESKDEESIMW